MADYLPIDTVLDQRRAQRHFENKTLPEGALEELLKQALKSPSGFNLQPWHITVVSEAKVKQTLCAACWNQAQVTEAPVTLVVSGDPDSYHKAPQIYDGLAEQGVVPAKLAESMKSMIEGFFGSADDATKRLWVTRQCSLLSMTLMLVAEAMGLSSCPMEGFVADKVRAAVGIPAAHEVVLVLPIGYGTGEKQDFGRFDMDHVTSYNRYEA